MPPSSLAATPSLSAPAAPAAAIPSPSALAALASEQRGRSRPAAAAAAGTGCACPGVGALGSASSGWAGPGVGAQGAFSAANQSLYCRMTRLHACRASWGRCMSPTIRIACCDQPCCGTVLHSEGRATTGTCLARTGRNFRRGRRWRAGPPSGHTDNEARLTVLKVSERFELGSRLEYLARVELGNRLECLARRLKIILVPLPHPPVETICAGSWSNVAGGE